MWWEGFSEATEFKAQKAKELVLIPMWWGGFSEIGCKLHSMHWMGLNPHVVGRFFRVKAIWDKGGSRDVLIPMWWGGFSESGGLFSLLNSNA